MEQDANQRLDDLAAVHHVRHAKELLNENSAVVNGVNDDVLALMLGRVIRELTTVNVRLDFLEHELQKKSDV